MMISTHNVLYTKRRLSPIRGGIEIFSNANDTLKIFSYGKKTEWFE
jgi:hypothetical protein